MPVNADGEIEEFFLWPIERVIRELSETDNFKFNVAFVIIDFLIRHGFVGPEDPDYLELVREPATASRRRRRQMRSACVVALTTSWVPFQIIWQAT